MSYIDLVDSDQKMGDSFAAKEHFKNFYKQRFLGILDFMLVNSRMVWNMTLELDGLIRQKYKNKLERMCCLLNWVDPGKNEPESDNKWHCFDDHFPTTLDLTSQTQK